MGFGRTPPPPNWDNVLKSASFFFDFIPNLDAGRDLLVALGHDVDDIGAVGLQETHVRPGDPLGQGPVGLLVLVDHGEHDQEVVLLGHTVDVAHAGVVQQLPVGVEARLALGAVKVTLDIEIVIKKELN